MFAQYPFEVSKPLENIFLCIEQLYQSQFVLKAFHPVFLLEVTFCTQNFGEVPFLLVVLIVKTRKIDVVDC